MEGMQKTEHSADMATYRMSFNEICSPLKAFHSSRELVISVRDAMEAHDRAYFDAHILHRNVNITNVLTSATGRGLLVDWDLSIESTSVRPMGTWQCMSAAVLRDPWRVQTIEDDRESAVHVLTLLALRHINHHELDQVASYLAIYNQVYYRLSGGIQVATGGLHKGDQFASSMFPTFTSDPLNRLLSVLSETFSARYTKAYSDEAIKKSINFMVSRTPVDLTNAHRVVGAYFYGSRMESLKKPNWLVEVFNEHLESYDWPSDDKASDEPSSLLTNSGSG